MPKKPNPIWNHFIKSDNGITCKFCGNRTQNRAPTRLKGHLRVCSNVPAALQQECILELKEKQQSRASLGGGNGILEDHPHHHPQPHTNAELMMAAAAAASSSSDGDQLLHIKSDVLLPHSNRQNSARGGYRRKSAPNKRVKLSSNHKLDNQQQQSQGNCNCYTTEEMKEHLDLTIADYIYGTSASFAVADSVFFQSMIKNLRPSYVPPTASELSGALLEKCFVKKKNETEGFLEKRKNLALVSYGWSNYQQETIVNFVIVVVENGGAKVTVLFHSSKTIVDAGNPQIVCEEISAVLDALGPEKFVSIVTDYSPVMRECWSMLMLKYNHLFPNGDAPHSLHTLLQEVYGLYKQPLQHAKNLVKFIQSHSIISDYFQSMLLQQSETNDPSTPTPQLELPCVTRWYSHYNCVFGLLQAKVPIQKLFAYKELLHESLVRDEANYLRDVVLEDSFWNSLVELEETLKPIVKALSALTTDFSNLSLVYDSFQDLLSSNQNKKIDAMIADKWAFIQTESMGMAYILNPKTRGGKNMLMGKDKMDSISHLMSYGTEFLDCDKEEFKAELSQFLNFSADPGEDDANMINLFKPLTWWLNFGAEYPHLQKIASQIYRTPTCSATSERIWSLFDFIQSKYSNRFSNEKVQKLVFVFANTLLKYPNGQLPEVEECIV